MGNFQCGQSADCSDDEVEAPATTPVHFGVENYLNCQSNENTIPLNDGVNDYLKCQSNDKTTPSIVGVNDYLICQNSNKATPSIAGVKDYLNCQNNNNDKQAPFILRSASSEFLAIHLQEPQSKMLLDQRQVMAALVEQVEELIRREHLLQDCGSSITSYHSDENMSTGTSVKSVEYSFERLPRMNSLIRAPTAVTTLSAATRKAGNAHATTKRTTYTNQTSPQLVGGIEFAGKEMLRKTILETMKASNRKDSWSDVGRNYLACNMLAPLPFAYTDEQMAYTRKMKEHMNVLHLRLHLNCISYYKLYLSRKQPSHPITRAVAQSIKTTGLSPSRKTRQHKVQPPDLVNLSDESSSSSYCDGLDFGAGPPSERIRLLVSDSVFLDLAVTGSLGLASRKLTHRVSHENHKLLKSPDQYVVLLNRRSGVPLAVCALKASSQGKPPVVRMFTTMRRVSGQSPAVTTAKLGLSWSESLPLYAWAEFVTEGVYPDKVCYSIYLVSDSSGNFETSPSYRATHEAPGSLEIKVTGRTGREFSHSGCATMSVCEDDENGDIFLKLSIAKGIDPALLICFSCFIDESLEKTMRLQSTA